MTEKSAYSIPEAAELVSCSERHLRALAARGELRVVRIGRRVVVTPAAIRELLERGEREAEPAPAA